MITLRMVALHAILSIARPPAVDVAEERPRLEEMASAIAEAVEEREQVNAWLPGAAPLPFSPELSVVALVAIAYHEGGLRAEVSDCRITGDRLPHQPLHAGRAIGDWQLQRGAWGGHSRREICGSVRLGARLALAHLARQSRRSPAATFGGYAGRAGKASRRQCAIWERLARRAGLDARCGRREVFDAAASRGR